MITIKNYKLDNKSLTIIHEIKIFYQVFFFEFLTLESISIFWQIL